MKPASDWNQALGGCWRAIRQSALGLLLAAAVSPGAAAPSGKHSRPNVLVILIDDQGYGDLSCHGNPILKTPNIDALAAESVRLTDFHVSAICSPTRAGLMTGQYPRKVGVHGTNRLCQHLDTDAVTMANIFSDNQYVTGIFGKWHLGDRYPLRPMDRGFSECVTFLDGAISSAPDHWGNDYFDDTYLHNGKPQQYKGYCTDVWFQEALRFIEKNKERPFFCYLPTNAAHAPFIAPEAYVKPFRDNPGVCRPEFYGMIASVDENLGRLRKRLQELGLEKNTLLIFLTDNGTAAGVHLADGKDGYKVDCGFNAGMRGKKGSAYDGGHRVPCFIHYPEGSLTGGREINELTAHLDILPTLIDLCHLECQSSRPAFDGASLMPLLSGSDPRLGQRVLIESFTRTVMTKRWRLVNGKELYDMSADPGQKQDVASAFPQAVANLQKELEIYWKTESPGQRYVLIGSEQQNDIVLTGEDWPDEQSFVAQASVAKPVPHVAGRTTWMLKVAKPGRYRLSLRRWPKETEAAINGVLPKEKWAWEMRDCKTVQIMEAGINIQGAALSQPVNEAMLEAVFTVDLKEGMTPVQAWFADRNKETWRANYLYAERL